MKDTQADIDVLRSRYRDKEATLAESSRLRMVRSHDVVLDNEHADWIRDVKRRYRSAQVKAAIKVNSEQLLFNWELGRDFVAR